MANRITSNGTFTIGDTAALQGSFNLTLALTMTGSNLTLDGKDINSGSWQGLNTSSLTDTRYVAFKNNGTGSVKLASTSTGGGINPIILPGDICIIPFSGSVLPLFAQAMINNTGSTLDYGVIEQ